MTKKQDNEIDTITITRKLNIIPIKSENNMCIKKVYKFHIDKINKKIEALVEDESKEKDKKKKEKISDLINNEKSKLEYFLNEEELTRSMINDYTYTLVRDAMESEARRKNYILSYAFSKMTEARADLMDIKERNKFISQLLNPAYRVKGSKKGSIFDETEIDNILGGYGFKFQQELLWSSFFVTLRPNFLPQGLYNPVACLVRRFVVIIRMRSYMIILYIRKFFDCCVEFFLCVIIMLINKIIFQCIEISFHRSIIIWISSLTHALSNTKILTKFCELF